MVSQGPQSALGQRFLPVPSSLNFCRALPRQQFSIGTEDSCRIPTSLRRRIRYRRRSFSKSDYCNCGEDGAYGQDVATSLGLSKTKEGAGNTVGYYAGVEPENGGFYMVLPLAGPSNARDAAGLMADYAVDPFRILTYALNIDAIYQGARYGLTVVDIRTRTMFALDDLEKNSVDYYAALRSAYTQQRADLIRQKREKTDSRGELDRRDNLALVR